jgi:hypothetical protein
VARIVKRSWLERMGLKAGEPSPGDWVVLEKPPLESQVGSSYADEMVQALTDAGIDARTEPYMSPDHGDGYSRAANPGPSAQQRVLVAVLVRRRDEARARELVNGAQVSDEELARLAEEAGGSTPQ